MKRRWMLAVGSAALVCAQLLAASCGDGSVISTGDTADVGGDADVTFPDVPVDTAGEDSVEVDSLTPDTVVPDTVVPDSVDPDSVDPDTTVVDTAEDTTVADTTDTVEPPRYVDWCRLQWPLDITVGSATAVATYGRVYVAGLTDVTSGNDTDADLVGRVGFGAVGTDPTTWASWFAATPNTTWNATDAGEPNNDEYTATIPSFAATGDFDFAFAFSLDGGANWTYCDRNAGAAKDGSVDGYHADDAGHATVVADPCATNPCTAPPSGCNGGTLEIYGSPGACADDAGTADCTYTMTSSTDCVAQGDFCDVGTLSCINDACTPNPCETAPDSVCEGSEKVSYAAPGTCDDTSGTAACSYGEAGRVDCSATTGFCARGDCRTWRLAGVGDLVITEIMPNPEKVVDSSGEWFEVKNVAAVAVNLWGLLVDDGDDGSDDFIVGSDVVIEPGAYAVLGRLADPANNGGVDVDYAYTGMALSNSGTDSLRIKRGADVIDVVTWGDTWPVAPATALQLDPTMTDGDNSDVANWCAGYTPYNDTDFGTPGADNDACVLSGLWCRLQWPLDESVAAGVELMTFGRVYVAGVTDQTTGNDPHPLLVGAAGFGSVGTTPDTWTAWFDATPNDSATGVEADNDEYVATLTGLATGTYDFAYRFSGDGGDSWVYCDRNAGAGSDGSQDDFQTTNAGHLTVVADPCAPNPCTVAPNACDANVLSVYATPGTCTPNGTDASCDFGTPTVTDCSLTSELCDLGALDCVADPCTPNPCDTPPEPVCAGTEVVTYVAEGTCTVDSGASCAYPESGRVDCGAQFCAEGACHDWRFVSQVGDLMITELMPNPAVVDDGDAEWFEVKNVTADQLNLRGVLVVSNNASENTPVDVDLIVDAGAYVVFGRSTNTAINGGVTVDFATPNLTLANSNDLVGLMVGDTVIDQVQYGTGGLSLSVHSGASLQLHAGATDNGDAHDWCDGTATYGTGDNEGTPGADNGICWLPVGWCRLQFPEDETYAPTTAFDAFGRYYVDGLTDVDQTANDPSPFVRGAFAISAPPVDEFDTLNDPATWSWTYADLNAGYGTSSPGFEANNDEWTKNLTAPATPGAYLLGFRVSGDSGKTWTYCDVNKGALHDGSEDDFAIADAGQITVSDPCDPNPCSDPPDVCTAEVLSTYASSGTCSIDGATFACDYGAATDTDCTTTLGRCEPTSATCVECVEDTDCALPFETCDTATTHACQADCVDDGYGSNHSLAEAATLSTDTLATDLVLCADTPDFYKVALVAGDTLDVLVEFTVASGASNLELIVYGLDGSTVVASDSAAATSVTASYTVPAGAAGDYTFVVRGAGADLAATYDMTVLFANDPCVPNPCDSAPAASCNGDSLVTPEDPGTCAGDGGSGFTCDYTTNQVETPCAAFCNGGVCTDWRYPENAGDLVITEYFADPSAGALGAWFEVYNPTADPLNLDQVDVFDLDTDSFTVSGDVIVQPGAYFVFGASADTGANGGVNVDYVWSDFTLDAAADEIALSWLGAADLDDIAWDAAWPTASDTAASLNPDVVATGNDAASGNDGAGSWCLATSSYGGGGTLGTPGAANDACVTTWTVGFCRLQWPPTLDMSVGGTVDVYGRVYIAGLTDPDPDTGNNPDPSVLGSVGYGPTGSLPAGNAAWTWSDIGGPNDGYHAEEQNNDEYYSTLTAPGVGVYDYAFRFSGDGGTTWLYCDKDGVTPPDVGSPLDYSAAQAGVLTVTAVPFFISEYIEGGSNNKAIELFNGGATAYDFAVHTCTLELYFNGAATATGHLPLTGTVPAGGTWTLCNSSSAAALKNKCQQTSGSLTFNGNDTVELVCDGERVDIFGKIAGGTADFAANVTLHRVCGTTGGDLDGTDAFDSAAWVQYAQDTFNGIGNYRPIVAGATAGGGKGLVFEAVDLVTKKAVLRNVSAADVTVTSAWRMCNFPNYEPFVSADLVIAPGASATVDIPANLALSASVDFELALYLDSSFGSDASMVAYVAVNAGGHTREAVAVTAGVWTAGSFITMAITDPGFALKDGATAVAADAYAVYGPYCTVR